MGLIKKYRVLKGRMERIENERKQHAPWELRWANRLIMMGTATIMIVLAVVIILKALEITAPTGMIEYTFGALIGMTIGGITALVAVADRRVREASEKS